MKQLLTSVARFSWSLSMLGAEQTGSALAALGRGQRPWRATEALAGVANAAERQLQAAARSDQTVWPIPIADLPRGLLRAALVTSRGSLAATTRLAPGRAASGHAAAIGLRELGNKLAVFEDFRFADHTTSTTGELSSRVAASRQLQPFRALWVLEGLGYRHGMTGGGLRNTAVATLGTGELLPLHTGLGLALARQRLDDILTPQSERHLQDLVEACRASSQPGYGRAVFEGLGLIVVGLAPSKVLRLDATLAERLPALRGAFWHGVGRGLYFSPRRLVPGTAWRSFEDALSLAGQANTAKPGRDSARRNVLAGLLWAVTLVNLPDPAVLAEWLGRIGRQVEHLGADGPAAVSDGISAALSLWTLATGHEALLENLMAHRCDEPEAARRWRSWVREPATARLAEIDQLNHRGPGALFDVDSHHGDLENIT